MRIPAGTVGPELRLWGMGVFCAVLCAWPISICAGDVRSVTFTKCGAHTLKLYDFFRVNLRQNRLDSNADTNDNVVHINACPHTMFGVQSCCIYIPYVFKQTYKASNCLCHNLGALSSLPTTPRARGARLVATYARPVVGVWHVSTTHPHHTEWSKLPCFCPYDLKHLRLVYRFSHWWTYVQASGKYIFWRTVYVAYRLYGWSGVFSGNVYAAYTLSARPSTIPSSSTRIFVNKEIT